jgi:penicillin G amidase
MRARMAGTLTAVVAVLAVGCSTSVGISITPAGPVSAVAGGAPTTFSAVTSETSSVVNWSISPAVGTLSPNTGPSVSYTPPAMASAAVAVTLTASVSGGGPTATVTINVSPQAGTAQTIPGLTATVTVTFDDRDIPNISCAKQVDCFAVQGYLHAQDRLFEMDVLRRIARGQLAELIGDSALSQDIQLRTFFTTPFTTPPEPPAIELALAMVDAMDATVKADVTAYTNGVNAYIAQVRAKTAPLPGEYSLLLYPVGPADIRDWTVADTAGIGRLQQFELSETLQEEIDFGQFYVAYGTPSSPLFDPAKVNAWVRCHQPVPGFTLSANSVAGGGGAAAALARVPSMGPGLLGKDTSALRALSSQLRSLRKVFAGAQERAGSNNWVVKGTSSATGASMVANDPHLALNYPPLFHLASLTGDGLQVVGGAFPGIPGALIGRGAHVGWGVTVVGYDVTDVYVETEVAPGKLAFGAGTVDIILVPQTVNYRTAVGVSQKSIVVAVSPKHGPIVGQLSATQPISMRWTGLTPSDDFAAFLGLLTAADVDAGFAVLTNYATGAQNFVLADDKGNIGFDPHAHVPLRPWAGQLDPVTHTPRLPWAPLPGYGSSEWGDPNTGLLWTPDNELPHGMNPPKGYFATANAAPADIYCVNDIPNNPITLKADGGVQYLSFGWDDTTGFRAGRIMERLHNLTVDGGTVALSDMESIQTDHKMTIAEAFQPAIDRQPAGNASYDAAKRLLDEWAVDGFDCPTGLNGTDPVASPINPDPTASQDSAACLLFHGFLTQLLVNVFTAPLAAAGQGIDAVKAIIAMLYLLTPSLPPPLQTFCVPQGATPTATSCDAQVVTAMVAAYDALTQALGAQANWRWGRLHTMGPQELIYPLIGQPYNPGPYARPGGAFTVDVGNPGLRTDKVLSYQYGSGSNVRWIAVMDGSATKEQLPGPIVDGPFVPGSPGLLGQYVVNQYFDFPYGAAAISAATVRTQTFTAP